MSLALLVLLPLAPAGAPSAATAAPEVQRVDDERDSEARSRFRRRDAAPRRSTTPVQNNGAQVPNPIYGGLGSCTGALIGGCVPVIPGAVIGMFTFGIGGIVAIPFVVLGAAAGAGVGSLIGAGGGFDLGHLLQVFVTMVSTAGWAGIATLLGAGLGMAIGMGLGAGPMVGVGVGMGVAAALLVFVAMAGFATYAGIGGLRLLFEEVLARPEQPYVAERHRWVVERMAY